VQDKDDDGTLFVDIVLPEGESIRDTLCQKGLAVFASNGYDEMYGQSGSPKGEASIDNLRAISPCIVLPSVNIGQTIPERVVSVSSSLFSFDIA